MEKTYFIAFEGIDGAGKDTQLHELVKAIKDDNNYPFGNKYSNVWVTREPTKITASGRSISKILGESIVDGVTASKYFVDDRIEHSAIIRNVLNHSHVLTSRYDLSTFSYQMAQGVDFQTLYDMHRYNSPNGCIIPDVTIVFDLPVDIAFQRISSRNSSLEVYETIDFQTKVHNCQNQCIDLLRKLDGRRIIIINANQPLELVTKEMLLKLKLSSG